MSILIKGMEMPTSCEKCPFLDYEEGFCFASGVKHESGWYESTLCPGGIKDGRHDECPLVPVPPHGRLIDGDLLPWILANKPVDYASYEDWEKLCDAIRDAPAIIPAEE
jgi:hypothetical protein